VWGLVRVEPLHPTHRTCVEVQHDPAPTPAGSRWSFAGVKVAGERSEEERRK